MFPRKVPLNISKPYHKRIHPPTAFLIYLPGFPSICRSAAVSLVLAKLLSRLVANKLFHQRNLLHTININHSLNEDYSNRGHLGNCGMAILIKISFQLVQICNLSKHFFPIFYITNMLNLVFLKLYLHNLAFNSQQSADHRLTFTD